MVVPVTFEILRRPARTLDLLLYLFRRGPSSVTSIVSDLGMGRDAFYAAADRLRSLGFAYEDKESGWPTHVYWGLTRFGDVLARSLGPAADLVSSTAVSMEAELARLEAAGDPATLPRRLDILDVLVDREFALGRWDRARSGAESLVELARAARDVHRQVRARVGLGQVLQKQDRHEDAQRELGQALRLATEAGEDSLASEAEYLLGSDFERQARSEEALERFASAARLATRADDRLRAARARQATGRILFKRTRYEEAFRVFREAAAEMEGLDAEDDLPRVYVALGSAAHSLDRPDEAATWYAKAVDAARKVGDVRMEAYGLVYGAAPWIDAGQYRKAESALTRAGQVFENIGERMGIGSFELNSGQLCLREGRWAEAEAHFDRALAIARETSNRNQEAWTLFNRGQMAKRRGEREGASALLQEAKRIFEGIGSTARVARCDEELRDLSG